MLARTNPSRPPPLAIPKHPQQQDRQERRDQQRYDDPENRAAVAVDGHGRGDVDHDPHGEGEGHEDQGEPDNRVHPAFPA